MGGLGKCWKTWLLSESGTEYPIDVLCVPKNKDLVGLALTKGKTLHRELPLSTNWKQLRRRRGWLCFGEERAQGVLRNWCRQLFKGKLELELHMRTGIKDRGIISVWLIIQLQVVEGPGPPGKKWKPKLKMMEDRIWWNLALNMQEIKKLEKWQERH